MPLPDYDYNESGKKIEFETSETEFLYEIGRGFSSAQDMKAMLDSVLNLIAGHFKIKRGSINIYDDVSEYIHIDIAYGYTQEEIKRGTYKPGEGIIGTVFKTGRPIVVPSTNDEPRFLNRTGVRSKKNPEDGVFICVPVSVEDSVIGTISIDKNKEEDERFSEELKTLITVSIMIANGVNERRKSLHKEEELETENRLLKLRLSDKKIQGSLIGTSGKMKDLTEKIMLVAPMNTTVLLTGESGTGKEVIADAIYKNSLRNSGPYIKVNIAALPDNLIESELFGHERGAFTGALAQKKGRFELANGGTIFLDEIGDLNLQSQVKLLRVIQEKTIERLGGTKSIPLDVRIISATHQNLEEKVERGEFRQDLYYRLNVFPIYAMPLRERRADIVLLADYFLEKYSKETGKNIKRISTEAIDMLVSYHWPGNIRELENCIQRAVIISSEDVIRSNHLPPSLQMAEISDPNEFSLDDMVNRYVKEIIIDALKASKGNITKAAQNLGTTKRILNYKIKQLGVNFMDFRNK
jgi:Nif-specific regulatory protein